MKPAYWQMWQGAFAGGMVIVQAERGEESLVMSLPALCALLGPNQAVRAARMKVRSGLGLRPVLLVLRLGHRDHRIRPRVHHGYP